MNPRTAALIIIVLATGIVAGFYLSELSSSGSSAAASDKGTLLFESVCANCHGKNGGGMLELKSPSIAALPEWYVAAQVKKFQTDMRGGSPEDLTGAQMRAIAHTLDQSAIEAVARHVSLLEKIPTTNTLGGVPERGKESYQIHCEQCHFQKATGDFTFKVPPLTGLQDWYLAAQLEKFRTRIRGGHPGDIDGAKMQIPSGRFLNEEDEKDVLAYIAFLANEK